MRLLISGGGTGGHVYPALTVAAALRKQTAETPDPAKPRFLYVGRANSIEEQLARQTGIPFEPIQSGQVRGKAPWIAARSLWRAWRSIGRVRGLIREFKPTVVFATGGYISAPVIWASAAEHINSVIYLPDLEPGWAIRASSHWATRVAVSFPEVEDRFARGKAVTTGYPVRNGFYKTDKVQGRIKFHLDPDARTVAIFGGSTGAHHINQAAIANLVELTRQAQVIHFTGKSDETWVNQEVARLSADLRSRVRVFGYLEEDLPQALGSADVVVARAGAATLGEFPALGLPAILVPGPFGGMHQERNADFLCERGAALKVRDAALKDKLVPTLKRLFDTPGQLDLLRTAMRRLAEPRAAENIVSLLYALETK